MDGDPPTVDKLICGNVPLIAVMSPVDRPLGGEIQRLHESTTIDVLQGAPNAISVAVSADADDAFNSAAHEGVFPNGGVDCAMLPDPGPNNVTPLNVLPSNANTTLTATEDGNWLPATPPQLASTPAPNDTFETSHNATIGVRAMVAADDGVLLHTCPIDKFPVLFEAVPLLVQLMLSVLLLLLLLSGDDGKEVDDDNSGAEKFHTLPRTTTKNRDIHGKDLKG